ncbi:MAG: recombination protein RecR [Hyphomicrobiales bacterium]|nr:recombination protein RecR [Hyphomicrobiales bacterium]
MAGDTHIDRLIGLFSRLPGLGPRSARRAVLHLLKQRESMMLPLATAIQAAAENVKTCEICGNLDTVSPCAICTDTRRDPAQICVVEEVGDLWAMERSRNFRGRYHVLGGVLSALDGRGPEALGIEKLVNRARDEAVMEVILATNATVEGQTTAHYISERLKDAGVKTSRLAHGIPLGGELDYLDDGTLGAALASRQYY